MPDTPPPVDPTPANTPERASDPRGLNVAGFDSWLRAAHPELLPDTSEAAPLTARRLTGGLSNLTYAVDGTTIPLVVRRPPLGHVLASAHDMGREYRVMTALAGSAVPVPETVDFVDDSAHQATDHGADDSAAGGIAGTVTGTPFLVMRRMPGETLIRREQNTAYSEAGLHLIGVRLAQALAALHAVDAEEVGLGDFGHPVGYVPRQLVTWRRQLDASRSRELPILARLEFALEESVPSDDGRHAIVHGDYRLDNALVAGPRDDPRITAVVDWEMSTLGDPLVDLGILGLYWNIGDVPGASAAAPSAVDFAAGYPTFDELVDVYAEAARMPVPDLRWYRAFAAFKLAVIAEGIHFRYRSGQTVGPGFDRIGELVEPLADHGLAVISMRRT